MNVMSRKNIPLYLFIAPDFKVNCSISAAMMLSNKPCHKEWIKVRLKTDTSL